MEERLVQTINNLKNWKDLTTFETNARERNQLTDEISNAIHTRLIALGRAFVSDKTELDLKNLSPAEERIIQAVSEYVGIMRKKGRYPSRTLAQLRNRGLIGAAESAVCKLQPTQGFQVHADAGLVSLSYEKIVVDHPNEFSPSAVWYSRKTLQLPNSSDKPPAPLNSHVNAQITNAKRNPPWSRDELILVLDLYMANRTSPPGKNSSVIIEMSELLNKIGNLIEQEGAKTYRNPNGVYMKMMNFRRFDPEYTKDGKVGLTRGNKDDEVVWNEFTTNFERLRAVALAIRSTIEKHVNNQVLEDTDEPDIQEAEEGRILTRLHRVRERRRELVDAKKKAALKEYGRLFCEACGFDFSHKYGSVGEGIIDVHHTRPVHTLIEGDITKLEDLALLCANCHRVVHSSRHWLTIQQVKDSIRS